MASTATVLEVPAPDGSREMRISSPERVLWPEVGITKLDLAEYLVAVAGPFVEANGNRPVSLQRFPDGVDGEQFFSKNPPRGVPDFIRTTMCTYPSGRAHPQLVIDEIAAAVWMVQMNTVVFHPWPTLAADTDNPDQIRLDLDPQPGTGFPEVVAAAHLVREVLTEAGLTAFVKTSGNRGLHLFAPIRPEHEFLDVRHAVIAAAREVERRSPSTTSTSWWKEERGERIFLDYNQAARDRTTAGRVQPEAAAHTLPCRARSPGTSSTPPTRRSTRCSPCRSDYGNAATPGTTWPRVPATSAPCSTGGSGTWPTDSASWCFRPTTRRCRGSRRACSRAGRRSPTDRSASAEHVVEVVGDRPLQLVETAG